MVPDMYVVQVKSLGKSKRDRDSSKILRTIPADKAFPPISASARKSVAVQSASTSSR
jgi:branched-chain amino acid transport system substrate-binding protein